MEYPRFVFKCPGPFSRQGGTYDHALVSDDAEYDARLQDGWFSTVPEAIEGKVIALEVAQEVSQDGSPTRAELEAKAKELNIAFDGRTSDAKLLTKITEALS
jgi:hypothetical protein